MAQEFDLDDALRMGAEGYSPEVEIVKHGRVRYARLTWFPTSAAELHERQRTRQAREVAEFEAAEAARELRERELAQLLQIREQKRKARRS